MIRPQMNEEKAKLISDALWEQEKLLFTESELLDQQIVQQIKPYDRERYAMITDGVIVLVEIIDEQQIICSKLDPP